MDDEVFIKPIYSLDPLIDDFSYNDVHGSHCIAPVSRNICGELVNKARRENVKYLAICIPTYNEEFDEMFKTLHSLMQNIEYFKKEVNYIKGNSKMREDLDNLVPVLVPIFDGTRALSKSMRAWINENFQFLLGDLDPRTIPGEKEPDTVEVRASCVQWTYPYEAAGKDRFMIPTSESKSRNKIRSKVKRWNERRKNSAMADRFIRMSRNPKRPTNFGADGKTMSLDCTSEDALMSDPERPLSLEEYLWLEEMKTMPSSDADLEIASLPSSVSAPRHQHGPVETNEEFHYEDGLERQTADDFAYQELGPDFADLSENVKLLDFFICPIVKRSNHRKHNSHLWFFQSICQGLGDSIDHALLTDCGTTFSPACVARLLAEIYVMPDLIGVTARQRVELPGPQFHPCEDSPLGRWCQGSHEFGSPACWKCWLSFALSPGPLQGIEIEGSCTISLAMFNLVEALPVMPGPCQLMNWRKMKEFHIVEEYFNLLLEGEDDALAAFPTMLNENQSLRRMTQPLGIDAGPAQQQGTVVAKPAQKKQHPGGAPITFTEFLRVNMRLAEDRILTFVSIFSTGFGTKWATGATFYYQPETKWSTLLLQRRRWTNGTFAGFLFCFSSARARSRIHGGMFDSHKTGKNLRLVYMLWSVQIVILCELFICPAIFGACCYKSLELLSFQYPHYFSWAATSLTNPEAALDVRVVDFLAGVYCFIWGGWTIFSFYVRNGRMPEPLCQLLAVLCCICMVPVYISLCLTAMDQGFTIINILVLVNLLIPFAISFFDSMKSAWLSLCYLPWLLALNMFFIVFVPSYSFARLYDTSWGNRSTGKDSLLNDQMERYLKKKNFQFVLLLVVGNIFLLWAFIQIFSLGYQAIVAFLFVAFFPLFIQLAASALFLLIVKPLRYYVLTVSHYFAERRRKALEKKLAPPPQRSPRPPSASRRQPQPQPLQLADEEEHWEVVMEARGSSVHHAKVPRPDGSLDCDVPSDGLGEGLSRAAVVIYPMEREFAQPGTRRDLHDMDQDLSCMEDHPLDSDLHRARDEIMATRRPPPAQPARQLPLPPSRSTRSSFRPQFSRSADSADSTDYSDPPRPTSMSTMPMSLTMPPVQSYRPQPPPVHHSPQFYSPPLPLSPRGEEDIDHFVPPFLAEDPLPSRPPSTPTRPRQGQLSVHSSPGDRSQFSQATTVVSALSALTDERTLESEGFPEPVPRAMMPAARSGQRAPSQLPPLPPSRQRAPPKSFLPMLREEEPEEQAPSLRSSSYDQLLPNLRQSTDTFMSSVTSRSSHSLAVSDVYEEQSRPGLDLGLRFPAQEDYPPIPQPKPAPSTGSGWGVRFSASRVPPQSMSFANEPLHSFQEEEDSEGPTMRLNMGLTSQRPIEDDGSIWAARRSQGISQRGMSDPAREEFALPSQSAPTTRQPGRSFASQQSFEEMMIHP